MKIVVLVAIALLITACVPAERGTARIELFKQCMELATKMPRQSDDDVADIVEACSSQSHYMTNYIN